MQREILSAGTVLPISSKPIKRGAVLVEDGIIQDVGPASRLKALYPDAHINKLGGGILLPGLINAHTHLELGWMRERIGYFGSFIGWIKQIINAKRQAVPDEEIEGSIRDGINMLIKSGVTTVGEISSFDGLDIPILKNSRLRVILFKELFDWNAHTVKGSSFQKNGLYEERPFPHAPYSCSADFLKKFAGFYKDNQIPCGIHLAESTDEVRFLRGEPNGFEKTIFPLLEKESFEKQPRETPFKYLKNIGFFEDSKTTLVHMVHVKKQEIAEIADSQIGVVMCPRSNAYLKVGRPPLKELLRLERIGIGTDGLSSNYNLDMFEELRFLHTLAAKPLGKGASFATVYSATLGGARSLFIEDKTGSIEKGKEADLIYITPEYGSRDPYFDVISSRQNDLKLVMVAGSPILSKL